MNKIDNRNKALKRMKKNLVKFINIYVKEQEKQTLSDALNNITTFKELEDFIICDFYDAIDNDYEEESEIMERKFAKMIKTLEKFVEKEEGKQIRWITLK